MQVPQSNQQAPEKDAEGTLTWLQEQKDQLAAMVENLSRQKDELQAEKETHEQHAATLQKMLRERVILHCLIFVALLCPCVICG